MSNVTSDTNKRNKLYAIAFIFMFATIGGLGIFGLQSLTNVNSIWELDTECYGMSVSSTNYPNPSIIWTLNNPPHIVDEDGSHDIITQGWIDYQHTLGYKTEDLIGSSIATQWSKATMEFRPLVARWFDYYGSGKGHYSARVGVPLIRFEISSLIPCDKEGIQKDINWYYSKSSEFLTDTITLPNGTVQTTTTEYETQLRFFKTTIVLSTSAEATGATFDGYMTYIENQLTRVIAYLRMAIHTNNPNNHLRVTVGNVYALHVTNGYMPNGEDRLFSDEEWAIGTAPYSSTVTENTKIPVYSTQSDTNTNKDYVFAISASLLANIKYHLKTDAFVWRHPDNHKVVNVYSEVQIIIEASMNRPAKTDVIMVNPKAPNQSNPSITGIDSRIITFGLILALGFIILLFYIWRKNRGSGGTIVNVYDDDGKIVKQVTGGRKGSEKYDKEGHIIPKQIQYGGQRLSADEIRAKESRRATMKIIKWLFIGFGILIIIALVMFYIIPSVSASSMLMLPFANVEEEGTKRTKTVSSMLSAMGGLSASIGFGAVFGIEIAVFMFVLITLVMLVILI